MAARWTFYIDKDVKPSSHGEDVAARLAALAVARRK
jgi:hypothetical protein